MKVEQNHVNKLHEMTNKLSKLIDLFNKKIKPNWKGGI